ncbi:MAG: EamA family transporter [Aeromonadales bacterium]|nr:EamA family transporter [Aeromonadales bacterium]
MSAIYQCLYHLQQKVTSNLNTYTALNYEMLGGILILVMVSPVYLIFNDISDIHLSYSDISYLLLLSTVFTALLYLVMIGVTAKLSAFTENLTLNLEPVYSILWAMVLFNKQKELNGSFYIGVLLVFLSVFLQNRSVKQG